MCEHNRQSWLIHMLNESGAAQLLIHVCIWHIQQAPPQPPALHNKLPTSSLTLSVSISSSLPPASHRYSNTSKFPAEIARTRQDSPSFKRTNVSLETCRLRHAPSTSIHTLLLAQFECVHVYMHMDKCIIGTSTCVCMRAYAYKSMIFTFLHRYACVYTVLTHK